MIAIRALAALCVIWLIAPLPARADAAAGRHIIHVLNRLALGPTAEAVAHVKAVGIDRYIDEQLDPGALPEPAVLTDRLATLDTQGLSASQLFAKYGPQPGETMAGAKPTQEMIDARVKRADSILQQARAARVYRALYGPRQLQEVMVDFWFNHFNVNAYNGFDMLWVGNFENEAIRPHVLGHFRDLVLATAQHPAMLYYLDNQDSTAPGSPSASVLFSDINENYARELMELHTLGVDGGYTQQDVTTLAHILTGWGFNYQSLSAGSGPAFAFIASRHDPSEKTFLGQRIAPGGIEQGIAAIDILAKSPATAHHIAFELAQYFVADQPPPALVDRLTQQFLSGDGDIKAVMKALLTSPEFRDSAGQKYKTPYQYVLSAVRATGGRIKSPTPFLGTMAQLGMPLYLCPTPDGYKNTQDAWLSPSGTTDRTNFATLVGSGALLNYVPPDEQAVHVVAASAAPDAAKPIAVDTEALQALLNPVLSDHTRAAIAESPATLKAALILGSPDFMRR
ncbi:MAG TPA: DUF1800 domain-containing protein [Stellaceae bacterium]|nr:DUF1800 domain-containing protein [Stellaceae bacterium]